ncbi:MAG: S49 family peptidase, partial [Bacteroidales bacterium]|nr:S49 family peptidase [Bacteroidales bacterium]
MLKKFFLGVASSFVGAGLAIFAFSLLAVVFSIALVGSFSSLGGSSTGLVQDNSILQIELSGEITERGGGDPDFTGLLMGGSVKESLSLEQILKAVKNAKTNDKIKGIYLKCEGVSAGFASLYEIRKALAEFREESKKPIYSYGYESISQSDYYLASAGDSIFVNPVGMVEVTGLASMNMMFKDALDKLGVEVQVVRVGTFKSAVEPYMLNEISEANRMQQQHYMGNLWKEYVDGVCGSRGIKPETFNLYVDSILTFAPAEELMSKKLV